MSDGVSITLIIGAALVGEFVVIPLLKARAWRRAFAESVRCPRCLGHGTIDVLIRGTTCAETEPMDCSTCKGTGKRTPPAANETRREKP